MLVHRIAPFPTGDPGAYALVGMGTLFAGIIRAPMTSVFMIFEITQDYQILVPLMVANMLSFMISKRYQPAPVYHALLRQDGVHLPSPSTQPRDVDEDRARCDDDRSASDAAAAVRGGRVGVGWPAWRAGGTSSVRRIDSRAPSADSSWKNRSRQAGPLNS